MYKKLFFSVLMLSALVSVQAQQLALTGNKGLLPVKGGKDGKTYAFITKTDLSKQALVDSTTSFLSHYGLVNKLDVKLDEINEATSEITIPFFLRQTVFTASGMMGVKMNVPPVKLHAELRFEFTAEGGALVVIQNMNEEILQFVDGNHWGFAAGLDENPAYQKYKGEEAASLTVNSVIGKVLIAVQTGLDGYKQFMAEADKYFADIDEKYQVYDKLVKGGVARWCTDGDYVKLAENSDFPGKSTKFPVIKRLWTKARCFL
ncbi:MAG: hypothetical protein LBL90_07930 [Prevotellaceae bacterium]|nr:hypothetical protein [Prevotellaceae bacterium]